MQEKLAGKGDLLQVRMQWPARACRTLRLLCDNCLQLEDCTPYFGGSSLPPGPLNWAARLKGLHQLLAVCCHKCQASDGPVMDFGLTMVGDVS